MVQTQTNKYVCRVDYEGEIARARFSRSHALAHCH